VDGDQTTGGALARRIRFTPSQPEGFRAALNARVTEYLKGTSLSRVAGPGIYAKGFFYGCAAIAAYTSLLFIQPGGMVGLLLAALYGLSVLLLAINVSHDAAHRVLTGHRRADAAIHRILFAAVGVDGHLWQLRHNGSHHIFPNVNGCDIDIDENPLIRLSPNHARKAHHRVQHLYAPFLYMATLLHSVFWGDPVYLRKTALANMRNIRHRRRDIMWFFICKAVYLAVTIGVPLAVLPFAWWEVLLGYAFMTALMSLVFIALLVGTHFSDEAVFPHPGLDGDLDTDWAVHQLTTTLDWRPTSWLALAIAGGANAHAAHHLFPYLSHRHYAAVTPIIRATARDFGLPYHEASFSGMVASHFRHLKRLGARD